MFLATANNRDGIPPALYDRMEVIEVPGYTRTDKLGIAREFLVPKQLSAHGLTDERLEFTRDGHGDARRPLHARGRRARARARDRRRVPRHRGARSPRARTCTRSPTPEHVERVLGPHKHRPENAERELAPGVATGLAWTPGGGDILFIEATQDARQGQRRAHRQHAQRDAGVGDHRRLVRAQQGRRCSTSIPSG